MVQVRADVAAERAEAQGPSAEASGSLSLDRIEGISTVGVGCGRWPRSWRLLNVVTGQLVMGRCGATNLCRYCQALYVLQTTEMLLLDAAEDAPELWMVLTARSHLTRKDTYVVLAMVRRVVRRRWPTVRWFVQVEFQRRGALHLNLIVKGVPGGDRQDFHDVVAAEWCSRVDAEPVGQWSGLISDAGGLARYLAKTLGHGLKREQAPPVGWKGHRTSHSRDYFRAGTPTMRVRARESLARQWEVWRARESGAGAHDAELQAWEALRSAAAGAWLLTNDRGARIGPLAYDVKRLVLTPRTWTEPDLLLQARALLAGLEAGIASPPAASLFDVARTAVEPVTAAT